MSRPVVAIVGPGHIGTDLLVKLRTDDMTDVRYMVGVDPDSEGLRRAAALGLETSAGGVEWLLAQPDRPDLVFEATSAAAHRANAPRYEEAGIVAVDLTPGGDWTVRLSAGESGTTRGRPNLNMITCGGQATIPIVHAVSRITPVSYAEIIASIASRSAGPGTRASIDEFTVTTARAIEHVGGAQRGKAIVVLNPVEPPMMMRDTVFCAIGADADSDAVVASIHEMVTTVQQYVPGYALRSDPTFDAPRADWDGNGRVAVMLEVRGNGDHLPPWAGNLDIMTAAATRVARQIAEQREAVA